MSIEHSKRAKAREPAPLERRARFRWSWLLWVASASVACGSPAPSDTNSSASNAEATWCEVQAILQQKCQRCHRLSPEHGAPFSLLTYADTQEGYGKGQQRFTLMAAVIDSGYMPPQFIHLDPPVEPLTADERVTVLAWCSQGATLNGSESCTP